MQNKLPNIRSNDGRFHNGNPATGSLGTIVDDVWLNNVQDSLQDFFDELNNVLALVSVQANPAKKTQVAEAITTLIGNVRRVADSNTRSLQNVIYNSKKSNAIDSPSSDTVATSFAVKTAHDKALQAERLASLYSAGVADNVHCDNVMDGLFVTNVGTPNGETYYVINLKYKQSGSRGQIAISYWDANPKIWIRNKYDTEPHFSAWMRVDGADWDNIRNKVNASLTKYGLAQYRDDINLDSSDFAATPKAVKHLNDKKLDKLVQQTLDLTSLDPNKWYPVILKVPDVRKLYRFAVRRTLGDGNNPPWGTHGGGFTAYCEWITQPSSWGVYPYIDSMRLIRQFTFAYCHQSPMLKIGQIYQASLEYIYLRGGTSYTLSRESDVIVDIGVSGYTWQQSPYSANLPIIESYDESLVPKTYRTALSTVSRRDYSRRINGTAAGQTHNQMDVVGSVHIHPDGRIVQILHLKHFRDLWFQLEDDAVGYVSGTKGYQIPLQLWTAMPNKVLSVQPQLVRATHPTSSVVYAGGEAGEHICAWDLRKQGNSRDRVTINMSRFRGQHSEHIDMYVVVEGY